MSRSVWTHSDAAHTVFFPFECDDEYDGTSEWEWLIDDIRETFTFHFKSFDECDDWTERESQAILRNEFCDIVISEYCGLVSLGVVPTGNDDWDSNTTGIAQHWVESCVVPFLEKHYGLLRRVATFSNGEAVFEKRA